MKQKAETINSSKHTMIPFKVFYPFFDRVPKNEIDNLYKFMNLGKTYALFQRDFITETRFNQLNEFLLKLEDAKFSRVIHSEIYDDEQRKQFLTQITKLINSNDFKEVTGNKWRNKLVEEQKRLFNNLKQTT